MNMRKRIFSGAGIFLLILCMLFTSLGLGTVGMIEEEVSADTGDRISQFSRTYNLIQINSSEYKDGDTLDVLLCYMTNEKNVITNEWNGGFVSHWIGDLGYPMRFTSKLPYWKMQYLTGSGKGLWYFYITGYGWLKNNNGQWEFRDKALDATGWEITRDDSLGVFVKDSATNKYLWGDKVYNEKFRTGIYKKEIGKSGLINYINFKSWYGNSMIDRMVYYEESFLLNININLPCNTDLTRVPEITSVTPSDSDATYTIVTSGPFSLSEEMGSPRYKSTGKIITTSENGDKCSYTVNFYVDPHNLSYSLYDNKISERCNNQMHGGFSSAELIVTDSAFTGRPIESASVKYGENWCGGDLDIDYSNNVAIGTATATITKGDVTVSKNFQITKGVQAAPEVNWTDETIKDKNDGTITGLDSTMEIRRDGGEYTTPTGDAWGSLAPGIYYVRYKETAYYNASEATKIVIMPGAPLSIQFIVDGIAIKTIPVEYNNAIPLSQIPEIPPKVGYDQTPPVWDNLEIVLQPITSRIAVTAVYTINKYDVDLVSGEGYSLERVGSAAAVEYGDDCTFKLTIDEGYSKLSNFAVKVNGEKVTLIQDQYRIGNIISNQKVTVEGVADITAPTAMVKYNENPFRSFMNKVTFGLFFKKNLDVTIQAADAGSGVGKVEYLKANEPLSDPDTATGWTEGRSLNISQNEKFILYVRATDNAGNTSIYSDGVAVYADSEVDTGSISYTLTSGEDRHALVDLNGNSISGVRNGDDILIKDTDYTVSRNAITFMSDYLEDLDAGDYDLYVSYAPLGEPYVDAAGNDKPAETQIRLKVSKAEQTLIIKGHDDAYTYGDLSFDVSIEGQKTAGKPIFEITEGTEVAEISGSSITVLKAGTFKIKATAPGNDKYTEAEVTSDLITVNKAVPIVEVKGADVDKGQNVTLDVTVTKPAGSIGYDPDGTVTFKEGSTVLAEDVPLIGGSASYTTNINPDLGNHKYTASYSGMEDYYSAASDTTSVIVRGIEGINITPRQADVIKGESKQFKAETIAFGGISEDVNWSVTGEKDSQTKIDASGLLTVYKDESAKSLTVTAISVADDSKQDTVSIKVLDKESVLGESAGGSNDKNSDKSSSTEVKGETSTGTGDENAIALLIMLCILCALAGLYTLITKEKTCTSRHDRR